MVVFEAAIGFLLYGAFDALTAYEIRTGGGFVKREMGQSKEGHKRELEEFTSEAYSTVGWISGIVRYLTFGKWFGDKMELVETDETGNYSDIEVREGIKPGYK